MIPARPRSGQRTDGLPDMPRASTVSFAVLALVIQITAASTDSQITSTSKLTIITPARSFQAGDVVLLQVTSPEPLEGLGGHALDRPLHFFPLSERTTWAALVGVDLEREPGGGHIAVRAQTRSGVSLDAREDLEVTTKEFPTRRLTVDPAFVEPPPKVRARIARESELLRVVYGAVSAERLWDGPFLRPVSGVTVSGFGARSVFNGRPLSIHAGADFRGGLGTPIHAPNAGRVVLAQNLYYAGNSVIVDHGQAFFSQFAHLSRIDVHKGDMIEKGQMIGAIGATGRVTGPHLHWSVRIEGARVDPVSLISALREQGSHP